MRICFVCSGNICRSPTAEVVLTHLAARSGHDHLVIDSAGTGGWHAGDDMDPRSRAALIGGGYRPGRHVAKQFGADDFAARDLVVALDGGHVRELTELAARAGDPDEARAKIVLLREHDPHAVAAGDLEVADPYYGGADGFARVLRQIEAACAGLLAALEDSAPGQPAVGQQALGQQALGQQALRPPK